MNILAIDELLHTDDPISKGYGTDKKHLRQRYTLIIEALFIKKSTQNSWQRKVHSSSVDVSKYVTLRVSY